MSYETGLTEVFWQVGAHPVRILKGSKPADQKRQARITIAAQDYRDSITSSAIASTPGGKILSET